MTDNKPTHEDEFKAYPDEIGICAFKDGTYEVYPEHAEIAPAVKYIRADRTSTPPAPQAEGDVGEAIERLEEHNKWRRGADDIQMCSPSQLGKDIETIIAAAEEAGRLREELEEVLKSHDEEQDMAVKAEEEVKELRLELAKSKEQWQPIASAPRDGTYILVCHEDRKSPEHRVNIIVSNFENGYFVGYPASYQPTHWLPLPEPPPAIPSEPNCGGG